MKVSDINKNYVLKLKALSDTMRLKMIACLDEIRTVKQIADILETDHHALYHHMKVLENVSIVKLVKTRKIGNITEKYYKLSEDWYVLPPIFEETGLVKIPEPQRNDICKLFKDLSHEKVSFSTKKPVTNIQFKVSSAKLSERKSC